jgi:hypothetical protein
MSTPCAKKTHSAKIVLVGVYSTEITHLVLTLVAEILVAETQGLP